MKKFILGFLMLFCSFVSLSYANEPPEVFVFRKASGDNLSIFKDTIKSLITKNSSGQEVFTTDFLGWEAFKFASANGHLNLVSNKYRDKQNYLVVFREYNKLKETITVEDFVRIGQGEGFRLPIERDRKTGRFVPFDSDPVPVVIVAETNQVATKSGEVLTGTDKLDSINASLQAAQKEISSLKASLKKLIDGNTNVAELKNKISETKNQLENMTRNLSGLIDNQKKLSESQSAFVNEMQTELQGVKTTMTKIDQIESRMEAKLNSFELGEKSKFESFKSEIQTNLKSLGLEDSRQWNVIIGIVLSILVIVSYLVYQHSRVNKTASKVKNLEIDVDGIKTKLSNLEFDYSAVSGESLKEMAYNQEKQILIKNVSSGINYVVCIIRESEFIFSISGINRRPHDSGVQKIDIRKTNVRNMIINAGEPLRFCRVSPEIVISEKEKQAA